LAVDGARAAWARIAKTIADGAEEKGRRRRMRQARAELKRNEVRDVRTRTVDEYNSYSFQSMAAFF
jgi:hypothetical protein